MRSFSELFYLRTDWFDGLARLVDVQGELFGGQPLLNSPSTDYWAISADWHQVGLELGIALSRIEAEHGAHAQTEHRVTI
jgi:hypothetical protein